MAIVLIRCLDCLHMIEMHISSDGLLCVYCPHCNEFKAHKTQ